VLKPEQIRGVILRTLQCHLDEPVDFDDPDVYIDDVSYGKDNSEGVITLDDGSRWSFTVEEMPNNE
jgi:hypothetical protein